MLLVATLGSNLYAATLNDNTDKQIKTRDSQGIPTSVVGNLGFLDTGNSVASESIDFLHAFAAEELEATGDEMAQVHRESRDDRGNVHIRLTQTIHGLPVIGAQMVVHAKEDTGEVWAVNGRFVSSLGLPEEAQIEASEALKMAMAEAGIETKALDKTGNKTELVYILGSDDLPHLAWRTRVEYESEDGIEIDDLYAEATTGALVDRHPQVHRAKRWQTYDANNSALVPGNIDCDSNESECSDEILANIHHHTSQIYDYYLAKFGRISYDDSDITIRSSGHYRSRYNNALWFNGYLVYGDGDGVQSGPFGNAFDIVGHEFTHAVTQFESGLIYRNESGALNEALSDIFGAAAEAWLDDGVSTNTWKIGEDTWTPTVPGDALRYMDNPTQDGVSRDYYPERYTGSDDNGGVHWNSGIANLAFQLLVEGGTHPREKTSNQVPAIGLHKAEQIFYRAQMDYLTPSSNFEAARNATALAAQVLYGNTSPEVDAVQQAWCAVGVPGCPEPNQPPVARFTYSCNGLQCTFDGRSSTDDNGIVDYSWSFSDGATATGSTASHFFPQYYYHRALLTVTDSHGATASKARWVYIGEPTITPRQGNWYNPNRSGNGIDFYRNGQGNYVLFWYTYTANGTPIWYISDTGPKSRSTWTQPLYKTTWNGSSATLTQVGTVKMVFSNTNTAWFSWTLNGQSGGERFQFLAGNSGRTGAWYPPAESGWGVEVSEQPGALVANVAFYVGGQPRWVHGQANPSGNAYIPVRWFTGTGLCPSCSGGSSTPPPSQAAGSIRLNIASPNATTGTLTTSILVPGGNWFRYNVPISKLAGVP